MNDNNPLAIIAGGVLIIVHIALNLAFLGGAAYFGIKLFKWIFNIH